MVEVTLEPPGPSFKIQTSREEGREGRKERRRKERRRKQTKKIKINMVSMPIGRVVYESGKRSSLVTKI